MEAEPKHILVVEDDNASQALMRKALSGYRLSVVGTGEEGLAAAEENPPDIAILDINLPGIDGYETCRGLRERNELRHMPIIFLSSCTDLEDRLAAYGAGGNDYISKPFDLKELNRKLEQHCRVIDMRREAEEQMMGSLELVMDLQSAASKIQSISRFIQTTLFCHDLDMIFWQFFKTAREIDLDCVLQINTPDGVEVRASSGGPSTLEREILEMSTTMQRIHRFGADRAIYRWGNATLLARRVGGMIDTLALLMDGLEAGLKKLFDENDLIHQVEQVQEQNALTRQRVSDQFELMVTKLQDTIISLGLVSALDLEEEERLEQMLNGFRAVIDEDLATLGSNNQAIMALIERLRTPPEEMLALMDKTDHEKTDDFVMF